MHAGIIRAETGMKSPDALHVASAAKHHCEVFLTNDKAIRLPQGITQVIISEYI